MKVLLINPPSLKGDIYMKEIGRCGTKTVANEVWPQTGLACLAAVLEKDSHDVKIIDAMAENILFNEMLIGIKKFNPELIVMNTSTPTFTNDAAICDLIKKEIKTKIGFVGTHVSVLPERSMKKSNADFLIIGEAEYTLKELANNLPFDKIKGICYREDTETKFSQLRPLIHDLDELPFPSRNLLPNDKYTMPFTSGKPFATIIPSRGCPYKCIFCRSGSVWGKYARMRSPENVFNEMKKVKEMGIDYITFMADTFTINKKWTLKLCELIIENKLKVSWLCNSRVDTIDEDMLRSMKKAGCILISYGIESGDQEILDLSEKGITIQQSKRAVELTKKIGISMVGYYIIGLPGETWRTIKKTIDFSRELDTDYVEFHIATPFPGTKFYELAKSKGWLLSEDWEDFEEKDSSVLCTDKLSSEDLIRAKKIAMRSFYFRPLKILKYMKKIKNFSDFKSKLSAGAKLLVSF